MLTQPSSTLTAAPKMAQAPPFSSLGKLDPNSKSHTMRPSPFEPKKLSISILVISIPILYLSVLQIPPSTIFKDTTFWFLMSNSIIILVAADSGIFYTSNNREDDLYDEFIKHSRARTAVSTLEVGDHKDDQEDKPEAAFEKSIVVVLDKPAVEKPIPVCQTAYEKQRPEQEAASDNSESLPEEPAMEKSTIIPIEESASVKQLRTLHGARVKQEKSSFRHQKSLGHGRRNAKEAKRLRRWVTERREGYKMEEEEEENEYAKMTDEELNKRVEEFINRVNREIRLQQNG